MDRAHLIHAAAYVELNPVAARMVAQPDAWAWSSARAHLDGVDDGLTEASGLGHTPAEWREVLARGVDPERVGVVEAATRTGRPAGDRRWVAKLETKLGRPLLPRKRGPKPKGEAAG